MQAVAILKARWRDPVAALAPFAEEPFALMLLSGGGGERGRWSYLLRAPSETLTVAADDPRDPFEALAGLLGPIAPADPEGPPFQGGVAGLAAYELGARVEPVPLERDPDWPDLSCAVYPALLAFDHELGEVVAVGRGATHEDAAARARGALRWLDLSGGRPLSTASRSPSPKGEEPERSEPPHGVKSSPLGEGDHAKHGGEGSAAAPASGPLAPDLEAATPAEIYEASVADVISRIAAGEIFQANIARRWRGRLRPGARPFDLFQRLAAQSLAPFAAYLRLPGRAVTSNSPERFVRVEAGDRFRVETRPIKGTRPRGRDAREDAAMVAELAASAKDRAENLMIVDLMRNDLSRVCAPGAVSVPELCRIESFVNVHHLVSVVEGTLAPGLTAVDLLRAAFPPGSITGAPKVQAMKVIAGLEPPRGPYCGSIFWAGVDGAFDSSVLIRTAALVEDAEGWRVEARAGAGIVADSDPREERLETEAKIAALRRALTGPAA